MPSKRFAVSLGVNVKRFLSRGSAKDDAALSIDAEDVVTKDIPKVRTNSEESVEKDGREPEEASNRTSQVLDDQLEVGGEREVDHASVAFSVCLSADKTVEEFETEMVSSPSNQATGSRFKRMLTRARGKPAKTNADIVRLEDDDSRRDPEKVHRWLEMNRYKSKFLRDVWSRAMLNRRLKKNDFTRRTEKMEQNESMDDDGYCIEVQQGNPSMCADEDDDDWELGNISQDFTERSCSRYEASFYEELMAVLAFEYQRATGTCYPVGMKPKCTSAEDMSVETEDASSLDSYSTTDNTPTILDDSSHTFPQTLLQFVERKIEDEILNSNICLNMDVCDDFQKAFNGDCCGNKDKSVRQLAPNQNEFLF